MYSPPMYYQYGWNRSSSHAPHPHDAEASRFSPVIPFVAGLAGGGLLGMAFANTNRPPVPYPPHNPYYGPMYGPPYGQNYGSSYGPHYGPSYGPQYGPNYAPDYAPNLKG